MKLNEKILNCIYNFKYIVSSKNSEENADVIDLANLFCAKVIAEYISSWAISIKVLLSELSAWFCHARNEITTWACRNCFNRAVMGNSLVIFTWLNWIRENLQSAIRSVRGRPGNIFRYREILNRVIPFNYDFLLSIVSSGEPCSELVELGECAIRFKAEWKRKGRSSPRHPGSLIEITGTSAPIASEIWISGKDLYLAVVVSQ